MDVYGIRPAGNIGASGRRLRKKLFNLVKPFFIKNIDIYSECFEDKFSVVIEFSIVNIITKRGVLSE